MARPRDREQLMPIFKAELTACEAAVASPGDLKTLGAAGPPASCRWLRIRAGLLAAAGGLTSFPRRPKRSA